MWLVDSLINGVSIYSLLQQTLTTSATGLVGGPLSQPELKPHHSTADVWGFISNFKKGFAKPNRFRVEFTLPSGVSLNGIADANTESLATNINAMEHYFNKNGSVNIKCHTMTFPQRTLQTFETRLNSAPFKIPFSAVYDPITFSFYMDSTLDTRQYFEIWQAATVNVSNNTLNFYNEYVSDIKMFIENDHGQDAYGIQLYEAYPIGISIMEMAYNSDNQVLSTQITMSFKYWLPMRNTNLPNRTI